ncbi:ATAD3B, partial [Symbiodinium necroappetens]
SEDVLEEHPQSSRRVYMPGVLQTTTVAAMPRGRTILQKEASGSTIMTPRVSRERPLQPKDSSSPLLPGTGIPSGILVPASPRLISTSTSASLVSVATRGPSIGLRSKPSQSQSLWEPTQSQRQQRASSHLVLGHDANPFQQNGPASSGIPPDATTFTDAAPQLHS